MLLRLSQKAIRCSHCNASGHGEGFCSLRGKEELDITQRVHAVESAVPLQAKASFYSFPGDGVKEY